MGRYYGGDIEGKFWFGVQPSNDAIHFGVQPKEPELIYSACCDECPPKTKLGDRCLECSSDEECEAMERNELQFEFDSNHIETVTKAMDALKDQMLAYTTRAAEIVHMLEADTAWQDDKALDNVWIQIDEEAFNVLFNDIRNTLEFYDPFNKLVARFYLGTQILRCLLKTGSCCFWCEM